MPNTTNDTSATSNERNPIRDNLEALCEYNGVTFYKLAKDLGVSTGNLSDLRCGRIKSFSADKLQKISEYFGVNISDLTSENFDVEKVERIADRQERPNAQCTQSAPLDDTTLIECIDQLRERPEMKMLFKASKGATAEQISTIVDMLEVLKSREGKV